MPSQTVWKTQATYPYKSIKNSKKSSFKTVISISLPRNFFSENPKSL